jgi:hypothetical protein
MSSPRVAPSSALRSSYLMLLLVLFAAGCNSTQSAPSSPQSTASAPQPGGTFTSSYCSRFNPIITGLVPGAALNPDASYLMPRVNLKLFSKTQLATVRPAVSATGGYYCS